MKKFVNREQNSSIAGKAFTDRRRSEQVSAKNVFESVTEQTLRAGENKYRMLVEQASDGIHTYDMQGNFLETNSKLCEMLGYTSEELLQLNVKDLVPAEDLAVEPIQFDELRAGKTLLKERRLHRKDGTLVPVEISGKMIQEGVLQAIIRDITERKNMQILLDAQKQALEMVVTGAPLAEVLTYLTQVVEMLTERRTVASILLLDEQGRLRNGASPNLPENYLRAIDGIKADPNVGTCSAAAASRETVITPDISADVKWRGLSHLPLGLGFQAAWSMPIKARDGRVLGTFGTYFRDCREPTAFERQVVEILARTAALSIERKEAEEALRQSREELELRVRERTKELGEANEALQIEIVERRQAEEARVQVLHQLVNAQEGERRRIARDLHDHLGQQMTVLRLKLEGLKKMCDDGGDKELSAQVEEARKVARQIDADVDFLAWQMRPTVLDDLGIVAALDHYIRQWSKHFNIPAEFNAERFGKARLKSEVETNFYRIAQEALNNVSKHAKANKVNILLEPRDGSAVLIIEDNGVGFKPDKQIAAGKRAKGLGLIGMSERAALIGGTLEIESAKGAGTTVYAAVPVLNGNVKER